MADYCGSGRSNYFKVKDRDKFIEWINHFPDIEIYKDCTPDGPNVVGFGITGEYGGLPYYKADDDDCTEVDFMEELAQHLADGHVAIFIHCGNEKLRYLSGYTVAINSKGQREEINLDHIYEVAKKLGTHVTEAWS